MRNKHWQLQTFTVKELIEVLKQFDEDLPVFAEWENVYGCLYLNPTIEKYNNGVETFDCLVFDVNDY